MTPTMNLIASQILDSIHAHQADLPIVAAAVAGVFIALSILTRGGRRLWMRAFKTIRRPKLRFTAYERGIVWFGAVAEQRFIVSLNGIWKVNNSSRRDVTLQSFYVDGLATEHHMLMPVSGPRNGGALIPAGEAVDIETFCLVQKTLTWRSGTFVADVCFVDDAGDVHKLRGVRFNHIKQNSAAMTAADLSSHRREVA